MEQLQILNEIDSLNDSELRIVDSNFSDYLNDYGVHLYEKDKLNHSFKSFLLSFHITKNTDSLLNIYEILLNRKMYGSAERIVELYLSISPSKSDGYDYFRRLNSEYEKYKEVKKTEIDFDYNDHIDPVIIFLHVPKTAGCTVGYILKQQYPLVKDYIFHKLEDIDDFRILDDQTRNTFNIISGIFQFGIHHYINRDSIYFTFLRDPFERTISKYFHFLCDRINPYFECMVNNKMNLKEFVATNCNGLRPTLDNGQVRLISGVPFSLQKKVSRQMLDIAKENLEKHISVVGLNEKFDETLLILQKEFNWNFDPFYIKQNVTRHRAQVNDIDTDTLKVIKEKNEYDIELYEYAKELFEVQMSKYKGDIDKDVKEFRFFNTIYGSIFG